MTPAVRGAGNGYGSGTLNRTLVLAFSVVSIASCTTIGVLTYYMRAAGIRKAQYRLLETIRDEKVRSISEWFYKWTDDAAVMISRPDIRAFLEAHRTGAEADQPAIIMALTTMQKAYSYEAVFLADAKGHTVANTKLEQLAAGSISLGQAALLRTIRERKSVVSDVLISKMHGDPVQFYYVPITSLRTSELIGILGMIVNPTEWLYPHFASSTQVGNTGEVLLVSSDGVVQSPLKYREHAIASMVISAEPAVRGAAGEIGIIAVEDYRRVPVMAAYGHITELKWGIVVKQDIDEINAPVRSMAISVAMVSLGVMAVAVAFGIIIANHVSRPALRIAEVTALIGTGDLDVRAPQGGPAEIRQIAVNLNAMVEQLRLQITVSHCVNTIVEATTKHNNVSDLCKDVLPVLMETTRSQLGVMFLADSTGNTMDRALVHGIDAERIPKQITINPPSHLLATSLESNQITVLTSIPADNEMTINTQAGETKPMALLSIPLVLRDEPLGAIGLASVYDYDKTAQQIADGIRISLSQAINSCISLRQSEEMRASLDENNQELMATNEELRSTTEELTAQATELRELAQELDMQRIQVAQADKMKSEFLSNMSHELRTPLNSVLSLSQLMLEDGIGAVEGEDRERLEIIERNGRRLLNLINDILDLSKIESGKMDIFVSSFDVAEPVDAVVASIRPLADAKGLTVKVDIPEKAKMRSDKDRIQQVLLNLLSNAQKFTETGEIGIKVQQIAESFVFSVWDTGIGISEKALPYIFNEFRQVDGSATRQYGGTGLGLAICRRLIKLLGGTIEVESREGEGTTFTLTFPIAIEGLQALAEQLPPVAPGAAATRRREGPLPRILLVEDNPVATDQITRVLEASNFVVDVAGDGEEGLAKTREHMPDAMILDLMVPRMDGFQVLNTLRSNAETAHIPVLILTAKDLSADELSSLIHNNVRELVQKGDIDRAGLVASVKKLVGIQDDKDKEDARPARAAPRKPRPHDGKVTILIADDSIDNLKTSRTILSGMDLEILEASSGEEAVATVKAKRPDIVLMDIQMPVMSGIEATAIIRRDKELEGTIIIALTAKAMMGDKEEILAAGCDDYLAKPVRPDEMRAMVQKWTGRGSK